MVAVKICGLNDAASVAAAVEAGADALGFNFFPPSPRYVTPAEAAALLAPVPKGILRVGLFVTPALEHIEAALSVARFDAVQLYGASPAAALVRERFGVQVWRAVGVSEAAELPRAMDGADALVIEAKPPQGATRPGGNAVSFDWRILSAWTPPGRFVLAGGLTPANVAEAARIARPWMADVASGVATAPGVKDAGLIRAFIAAAEGKPPTTSSRG
jgi:phosphoribosylanthranilate isomerase